MNIRKILGYGILAVMLMLAGCGDVGVEINTGPDTQTPNPQGEPANTPAAITYTVAQDGGADGSVDTAAIKFTFSDSVADLTANDITVTDRIGSVTKGALSGGGASWSLAVNVASPGNVTVKIDKAGIEAGTKSVVVFKAGVTAPTLSGITATYTGTADIFPTTPLNSLKTNLTVTAQYSNSSTLPLSADEYTLTGPLTIGASTVTVSYTEGGVTKTTSFTVTVISSDITYTVAQIGGVDGSADSTGIEFTFSAPVNNLTAAQITVGGKAEKASPASLTGSGTTWTLAITVNGAGAATVQINRNGIEAGTKNVTVYKVGDYVPRLTVAFDADGGDPAPQEQSVEEGGTADEPETMTKDGFLFDGWYKEDTFTTRWNFLTNPVTENITLYAKWLTAYTVTFDVDDGSAVSDQIIAEGGKATEPIDPSKDDHRFAGWYKEDTFTTQWNFLTDTVTEDITLYAKWIRQYTVTFNSNSGSAVSDQIVDEGGTAVKPADPTRADYRFDNWYKEAGLTTVWNFTSDIVTEDITIYAKWIPSFIVTFSTDGGSAVPTQRVFQGGTVTQPADPTKAGYKLEGWYKETGLTNKWNFATDTVTEDITLYARWLAACTVTFNTDGGSAVASQTVFQGDKATQPANPTKAPVGFFAGTPAPYTVEGWYKENSFTTRWNFATDTVDSNITLYVKWTSSGSPAIDLSSISEANIVAKAITYINSSSETNFTLVLDDNVDGVNNNLNKTGVTLTITSNNDTERVISKGGYNSCVFYVTNATLVIDGHVTLQGLTANTNTVVELSTKATLELKGYAKITGNNNTRGNGGGVLSDINNPADGATVIMSGNAEISGNTSNSESGGGVYLKNGTLTMSDNAAIKNNTVVYTFGATGGGVYLESATFTMNGGEISGNKAISTSGGGSYAAQGGGVWINMRSTFTVASEQVKANIKNNTLEGISTEGAQVCIEDSYGVTGTFTVGGVAANTY